jgi:ribosomal subunit interface protein
MEVPLQVTYRGMPPSEALSERVREHASKLSTFHRRILGCKVAIEAPSPHHRHGGHFRVRVDVVVPGAELVVANDDASPKGEDAYAAVDGVFKNASRVLREHQKKQDDKHEGG